MRIAEMRKQRKIKQRDIAAYLNCTPATYCRYEKEVRVPPYDIVKKLAEYYGVTVDYLLGDEKLETETKPSKTADPRAEGKAILAQMTDKEYELALAILKLLQGK